MKHQTAAILVIGNEILSGRTHELNAHLAAGSLFARGCRVEEIAVVADAQAGIAEALNRLRRRYGAVITSGGIGPTHDDVTMQAVAAAFSVPLVEDTSAIEAMRNRYGEQKLRPARRRMAMVPAGSELILCKLTSAPGVRMDNVYVLAGVPEIFAEQLEVILPAFGSRPMYRREVEVGIPESLFADELAGLQQRFSDIEIGSYPGHRGKAGKICLSGSDQARLAEAEAEVRDMLASVHPA